MRKDSVRSIDSQQIKFDLQGESAILGRQSNPNSNRNSAEGSHVWPASQIYKGSVESGSNRKTLRDRTKTPPLI